MNHEQLASSWGASIRPASLADLDVSEVWELLRKYGVVWFRDVRASGHDFIDLSEKFCSSFIGPVHAGQDRNRVSEDGRTMTVNLGNQLVGHHSELGYSPLRPDVLWFHCATPAEDGGDTLLCDGVEVASALPAELSRRFASESIQYQFPNAGPESWTLFTEVPCTREETIARLASMTGASVTPHGSHGLDITYATSAFVKSSLDGRPAFCNSIITMEESVAYESGELIDHFTVLEILEVCTLHGLSLRLEAGDVIMIDNWRIMHGRTEFADPKRSVNVRMGSRADPCRASGP